nr:hypothetical protein [Tanacetum cinerariifolium]
MLAKIFLVTKEASVTVKAAPSMVATSPFTPSGRHTSEAEPQNYLTKEALIVGLVVKAYLMCEPIRKSII